MPAPVNLPSTPDLHLVARPELCTQTEGHCSSLLEEYNVQSPSIPGPRVTPLPALELLSRFLEGIFRDDSDSVSNSDTSPSSAALEEEVDGDATKCHCGRGYCDNISDTQSDTSSEEDDDLELEMRRLSRHQAFIAPRNVADCDSRFEIRRHLDREIEEFHNDGTAVLRTLHAIEQLIELAELIEIADDLAYMGDLLDDSMDNHEFDDQPRDERHEIMTLCDDEEDTDDDGDD